MTLIEHCITDEKSYLAVLKVLRGKNHLTITAHIDIVALIYQKMSGEARKWVRLTALPYDKPNQLFTIKIWPPELDP